MAKLQKWQLVGFVENNSLHKGGDKKPWCFFVSHGSDLICIKQKTYDVRINNYTTEKIRHTLKLEYSGRHFHRWHFEIHFDEWKVLYFDQNHTEVFPNWQWLSSKIDQVPCQIKIFSCKDINWNDSTTASSILHYTPVKLCYSSFFSKWMEIICNICQQNMRMNEKVIKEMIMRIARCRL